MTWNVTSTTTDERWLVHDGENWTADSETTYYLNRPSFAYPLTPTGPVATVTDQSTLRGGAMYLIPDPQATGDLPALPKIPSEPGTIY